MNIKKVIIDNFRNITHAEYDLGNRNIFIGPNRKGKTNTVLAIYWAITGYMFDGSNDDMSLKPLSDTKKEVSVELVFEDGWTFKKTYFEKWTTKRGNKEVVMEGHTTQYYVQGDKSAAKDALRELLKHLGLNKELETSKFGLVRAVIDPYYMGLTCDWAILRNFIIELVGDVSNENVYETVKELRMIESLLMGYKHDTAKAMKHLKSRIKGTKEEIDLKEKMQLGFKDVEDVSEDDLDRANYRLNNISQQIAIYENQKTGVVNQNLMNLKNQLAEKQLKLSEKVAEDAEKLKDVNSDINKSIESERTAMSDYQKRLLDLREEKSKMQKEMNDAVNGISSLKTLTLSKESELEKGRDEYRKVAESVFDGAYPLPDASNCPHCGGVLNESHIESIKKNNEDNEKKFNDNRDKKLSQIAINGKSLANEIDNLKFQLNELEQAPKKDTVAQDIKITELQNNIAECERNIFTLESQLQKDFTSEETYTLRRELNDLECAIRKESNVNTNEEINGKIEELKASKEELQSVLDKHGLYVQSQAKVAEIDKELDNLANTRCAYENQLILVESFIQTKLSMLQGNVEKVFGKEVTFTLVKSNIKEGSWDEVCYPSVINKTTPFAKGSESEKIITGIYLIECVKRRMQLPDLPIIFDAGSELDTETLNTKLETKSQLIMTKVDDIHYTDVTLIQA